jgi:hypothetical protein
VSPTRAALAAPLTMLCGQPISCDRARTSDAFLAQDRWEREPAGQAVLNSVALYFEVFRLQPFAVTETVPASSLAFSTVPVTVA